MYIDIDRQTWYNLDILGEGVAQTDAPQEVKYMPASKAQQKAVNKYMKENYDRFLTTFRPKGRLDEIKIHAAAHGESTNAFIGRAIQETMERDAGGPQKAAGAALGAGVVSLHSEALKTAQEAAEAAGESLPQFVERAISETAEQDRAKYCKI